VQNQENCGVFWTKFEHFLSKIRILNFKIQSLGRAKRKGVGGRNFCPPSLSAAAEFRANEVGAPLERFIKNLIQFLFLPKD